MFNILAQRALSTVAARPLAGKAALVTGSTSGIGFGIVKALAAAGADVCVHGIMKQADGEALARRISTEHNVRATFADHDMASGEQAKALVTHCQEKLGNSAIIVNNAGIQHVSPIESFEASAWEKVLAINLSSAFYTTKASLPAMRKAKYGRIINIASVHGLVASVNKSAYVAAKHGLIGFTKATALETAGTGVTANAICPGWVLTPLVENQVKLRAEQRGLSFEDAKRELLLEKQPSGSFATPEQLGAYVVFLCSDAAAQVTGASLTMDGGWTAQ